MNQPDYLSLSHAPGLQYRVHGPKGLLLDFNSGFSDLVRQTPVTPATIFNGYSVTKTFTALAVFRLIEQGKLALSDTVGDLLPEYPFSGKFTVEQLLAHQAGLANPFPLPWIHLADEDDGFDAAAFSKKIIHANVRLKYVPGTRTRYSNVGYLILGELIDRLSGMPFETYIREQIFEKIKTTGYLDFVGPETDAYATGYHRRWSFSNLLLGLLLDKKRYTLPANSSWIAFRRTYVNGKAYGGIVANATGLSDYLQALLEGRLFENPGTLEQLFVRKEPGLGRGWFTGRLKGQTCFCHAGGGGGYYCEIRVYPALRLSSVLMTNRSGFSDERLLDRFDERLLTSLT